MKRLVASVGVAAAALAAVGIAGPAANAGAHRPSVRSATPTSTYWTLTSATANVRTSTGKTLHLVVKAEKPPKGKGLFYFELFTGTSYGLSGESHEWRFVSEALAPTSGHATLNSRHDLGRYGSVDMRFSSSKKHTATCASGHQSYWYGGLSGKVTLNSQGRAWGSFSRKSFRFAGHNKLVRDDGCATKQPPLNQCVDARSWSRGGDLFGGEIGDGSTTIEMTRQVNLSSPKNAARFDILVGPGQKLSSGGSGKTLTIAPAGKAFTGKATIKLSNSSPLSYKCTLGGQTHTESSTFYSGPWSSSGKSRLAAHFAIDGNPVLAPQGGDGSYLVESYS